MSCQCFYFLFFISPPSSRLLSVGLKPFGGGEKKKIFEVEKQATWTLRNPIWKGPRIEEALKTRGTATLRLLRLLMFTASRCLSCRRYLELIAFSKSVCFPPVGCVRLIVYIYFFPRPPHRHTPLPHHICLPFLLWCIFFYFLLLHCSTGGNLTRQMECFPNPRDLFHIYT